MMGREQSALPENWVACSVEDVTEPVAKTEPSAEPERTIWYIDISSIDNKENRIAEAKSYRFSEAPSRARQVVRTGDTLFSLVRPYLRNIARVGSQFDGEIASTGFSVLRPSRGINPAFLFYKAVSQQFVDAVSGEQYGVSYPAVKDAQVRAQPVALPPPNEQHRIVEKIEVLFAELDKGEESLREVQKLLVRYRQSVLKAAVTGELTADWRSENAHRLEDGSDLLDSILQTRRKSWEGRGKYKEPEAPVTSGLPDLPERWVWASVDQLLIHLTSGSRDWKQFYGRGDGVFIMAQNVRPMRFDLSQKFVVDPPPDSPDAKRSEVRKDDLLVTIVGANTGDLCRFPLDDKRHYVCQSVALLRLADVRMSAFMEMFLSGKGAGRDQLEELIYGAGRPHLSFEQLRGVCVPLPPAEEQAEIILLTNEALERIGRIELACQAELTRSAALRQSILKEAFAGRLVPQDPNDEPAAELLARIRAERAADAPKPRRKAARKTA